MMCFCFFFFQADDGIGDAHEGLDSDVCSSDLLAPVGGARNRICNHPRECFLQPAHKRSTAVIRFEYVETRNTPFIEHRHGFVVDRRTYDSSGIELLVAAQRLILSSTEECRVGKECVQYVEIAVVDGDIKKK